MDNIERQAEEIAADRDQWHSMREMMIARGWNPNPKTPAEKERNIALVAQRIWEVDLLGHRAKGLE